MVGDNDSGVDKRKSIGDLRGISGIAGFREILEHQEGKVINED